MSDDPTTRYTLPDTLAAWPWARVINPFYNETKLASSEWINGFNVFTPKRQTAFELCDFSRLVALAYPKVSQEQLRAACDMMQLFFVFDEQSDCEGEAAVRIMADSIMDGMKRPSVTHIHVLGEISQQFWDLLISVSGPETQQRFVETFRAYTDAVVEQARDRDLSVVRDITDYFGVRRHTIGTYPCFVLLQLDLTLPGDIAKHPSLVKLETLATDMIILGNDLYSYNVEQARGDDSHNILTIVRKQYDWDLIQALHWVEEYHESLVKCFFETEKTLPSFGVAYDVQVAKYVDGLGNWVRANEAWSFEGHRYFGSDGTEIQRHRQVVLLSCKCM